MKKLIIALAATATFSVNALAASYDVSAVTTVNKGVTKQNFKQVWFGEGNHQIVENASLQDAFYKNNFGQSTLEAKAIIAERVKKGEMKQPITFNTDREVLDYLRANPGSVGYVQSNHHWEYLVKVN